MNDSNQLPVRPLPSRSSAPRELSRTAPATAALLAAAIAATALAHVFDLTVDFNYAANPNGQWAYKREAALLSFTPTPLPGPPGPCSTDGYWGSAWEAIAFRATVASSGTPGYGADDWLEGDVISYTPDSGASVRFTWTAPCSGTITYSGSVWYASTIVSRSNTFTLALNGGPPLATGELNPSTTRSNALMFASQAAIAVVEGDVLELSFAKSAGQAFGSFSGSALEIQFDSTVTYTTDLDGNCTIDGSDLGTLLGQWGSCPGCTADFNGDGVVDGDDLGTLLGAWTG